MRPVLRCANQDDAVDGAFERSQSLGDKYLAILEAKERLVHALSSFEGEARRQGLILVGEQAHALIGMVAIAFEVAGIERELAKEEETKK